MGTKPGIQSRLVELLISAKGRTVSAADMSKRLGVERTPVQGAMSHLLKKHPEIQVVHRASAWRWIETGDAVETVADEIVSEPKMSAPKSVKARSGNRVFSEIGVTSTGDILIQDTGGTVYAARKL